MLIHRVKAGETLYSISREYGVSPRKTAEINGLRNPDKIAVGRELLILFPTRTYTARRGDTVEAVSKRFSVAKEEILKNNPSLLGSDKIYPEEILSLGYCDRMRGAALIEGYLYNGCPKDILSRTIPYLSSLSVSSSVWEREKLRTLFSFKGQDIRKSGKEIRQRIYCPSPYSENDFNERVAEGFVKKAYEEGYSGITISAPRAVCEENFLKFLSHIKNLLGENRMSLTLECDGDIPTKISSLADRLVLTDGNDRDADFYHSFTERHGASRTVMDISPFASLCGEAVPIEEALAYIDERGIPLKFAEESGECVGAIGEKEIRIPSLEKTKARLDLIGELGLLGAAIDIMRCPQSIIMMLSAMYEINPSYFSGGM